MTRPLFDPALLARLAGIYPATVTIQQAALPGGSLLDCAPVWSDAPGLYGLACRVSPAQGQQLRRANQTLLIQTHTISLRGYYPAITSAMRAVVGSTAYAILFIDHDGSSQSTRLRVEQVTSYAVPDFVMVDTVALNNAMAAAPGFLMGVRSEMLPLYLTPSQEFMFGLRSTTTEFWANAVIGTTQTTYMPDWAGSATTAFDYTTTLRVSLLGGTLAGAPGATSAERESAVRAGANRAVAGELVFHFVTANLVSPGIYDLSGLLPGRKGSDYVATVGAGSKFMLLADSAGVAGPAVRQVQIPLERIGCAQTYYLGTADLTVQPQAVSFATSGHSITPLSPVRPGVTRSGSGDVTLRFDVRTRFEDSFWRDGTPPSLSDPLVFDVLLYNGSGATVLNRRVTFSTAPLAVTFTAADLTAAFGTLPATLTGDIFQVNTATVGRGFARRFTAL